MDKMGKIIKSMFSSIMKRKWYFWRAGASPPSRTTGLNFLYIYIYIYIYIICISVRRVSSTLRMRALRANVKPAHCKFKGRTFSANFVTQQTPVFLPQPTILCTSTVSTPAEPLSVWTSPHETTTRYAFLQWIVRYTTAVLPSCQQFIEYRVRCTVIKHTAGHVAFWPQPVGSLPLAQNAWHCTSSEIFHTQFCFDIFYSVKSSEVEFTWNWK